MLVTATAMGIPTTLIHGGGRGVITAGAAGLPCGAMGGEDTRVPTFTDDGETQPTQALAPRGRTHTRGITVAQPERLFKMLKRALGE